MSYSSRDLMYRQVHPLTELSITYLGSISSCCQGEERTPDLKTGNGGSLEPSRTANDAF